MASISKRMPLGRIRELVRSSAPDVLAFDEVDVFGTSAGPFLSELIGDNDKLKVITAAGAPREPTDSTLRIISGTRSNELTCLCSMTATSTPSSAHLPRRIDLVCSEEDRLKSKNAVRFGVS